MFSKLFSCSTVFHLSTLKHLTNDFYYLEFNMTHIKWSKLFDIVTCSLEKEGENKIIKKCKMSSQEKL